MILYTSDANGCVVIQYSSRSKREAAQIKKKIIDIFLVFDPNLEVEQ
jgi:hypothetical protein